jgi:hypothetical protein
MVAIDASIYNALGGQRKSAMDYADEYARRDIERQSGRQQVELGALALRGKQAEFEAAERARGEQEGVRNALAGLAPDAGMDQRLGALRSLGTQTALQTAEALEKGQIERARTEADLGAKRVSTEAAQYDLQRRKLAHGIESLAGASSPEAARQSIISGVQSGILDQQSAQRALQEIPDDPQQYQQWRMGKLQGLLSAKDQFDLQRRAQETDLRGESIDMQRQRLEMDRMYRGRQIEQQARTGAKLSPTAEKELFEAEDMAQSSRSAAEQLRQALGLNNRMYSGVEAVRRAKIRSNLPGTDPAADATIAYDNIIGAQALASLKATFGGAPTEGERKILVDLQASADKTPAQREEILRRAIAAAESRAKLNAEKADALRAGTYTAPGFRAGAAQQQPQQQPQRQAPQAGGDVLQRARDAIARGAPREAVIQRLRENGIDPRGL